MFQILSITLALVVGIILIIILMGDKPKKYDVDGFLKWSGEVHAGERISVTIVNHKATSESDSVKISFDFKKDRGTLYDKALKETYKIARVDGKYIQIH